jgi:hypothetical protein
VLNVAGEIFAANRTELACETEQFATLVVGRAAGAAGTFHEGVMASGYPTEATESAVQADITAAGYR